jgi:hypothetical protein
MIGSKIRTQVSTPVSWCRPGSFYYVMFAVGNPVEYGIVADHRRPGYLTDVAGLLQVATRVQALPRPDA